MSEEIINRVSNSGLVTIDLEDFYLSGERVFFDLKDALFEGIILKEKPFREFVKLHDWSLYKDKFVAVGCSVDAIIPTWAYMLIASKMGAFSKKIVFGNLGELEKDLYAEQIRGINADKYEGAKVVVKGCSKVPVPVSAYMDLVNKLLPYVSSIMYGEPCSTVPVFKKSR